MSAPVRCTLKAAVSLDGFLDDRSDERRIFSGPEDRAAVEKLRGCVDAIVIGAQTLRSDNPRLLLGDAEAIADRVARGESPHPLRVVLTKSGVLPTDAQLFTTEHGSQMPLVCCPESITAKLTDQFKGKASIAGIPDALLSGSEVQIAEAVLSELVQRGIHNLLVEGGAEVLRIFSRHPATTTLRLAIAPLVLGGDGRANLYQALNGVSFSLEKLEQLDSLSVLSLRLEHRDLD